jgi:type III secretion protein V
MTALSGVSRERPRFSFRGDGALAFSILAIVAILVVPLPALVLDVLLAANLALSIVALLATLYVSKAARMSAFPTLLLVAALARVSLAVAATRLILLHADAGSVVRSFGEFVVHGNYVVGVVIFVIITIVEFVVVARGGERVAEVAARFTLDALPGKQMAIDAEARAGTIDPDEARRRRTALEGESHFFGAMDGATKFIKGDVAASALIAVINVVGGFAVGIGQRGMDWEPALRKYVLLTIGAGLVIQIPALILATSAGILVTRVASEDGATLGVDLENQLLGNKRTLGMTAWFLLALAVVPGLPALPFALTAGVLFLLVWRRAADRRAGDSSTVEDDDAGNGSARFAPVAVPWSLDLATDIAAPFGRRSADRAAFAERLRARVFSARGVLLPAGRIAVDASLPDRHAVLAIREVPAHVVTLRPELPETESTEFVEDEVIPLLIDRAADFLGIAETKFLVDELEKRSPATVRHIVPKAIDLPTLAEVLRRLVDEGLSVKDLKGILEAIVRSPSGERDAATLAERVRVDMRRSITFELTGGNPKLRVFVLDSHIEEAVRGSISRGSSGSYVSLSPAALRDMNEAVERTLGADKDGGTPVLLVPSDIRRFVREILETDFPRLRVIAHDELLPEIGIESRGTVTLPND